MEKKILEVLKLSWRDSNEWAKNQAKIYADMDISLKEAKIVQCRENYSKSLLGDTYLDLDMPKLDDKQLVECAFAAYMGMYGQQLKQLIEQNSEVGIDRLQGEIKDDADAFFKNYLLERLLNGVQSVSYDIKEEYRSGFYLLFGKGEIAAIRFLNKLSSLKDVKPQDVVYWYFYFGGKDNGSNGNYQLLWNVIGENNLNLFKKAYSTLTRAFRERKVSAK